MSEHICASAIYYHSSNITESYLSFRHRACAAETDALEYEQDNHDWLSQVFRCEQENSSVQEIGSVSTFQGRLLTRFSTSFAPLNSPTAQSRAIGKS